MIGLLLSTVGLSAVHVEARFTFGRPELFQGISFIPAMIGLFGLSEVLRNLATGPADAERFNTHRRLRAGGFLASIWRTVRRGRATA